MGAILKGANILFQHEALETRNKLVELANLRAEEVYDLFLRRAIDLTVLGVDEYVLVKTLEAEIAKKEEDFALTFGLVGAVFGLTDNAQRWAVLYCFVCDGTSR